MNMVGRDSLEAPKSFFISVWSAAETKILISVSTNVLGHAKTISPATSHCASTVSTSRGSNDFSCSTAGGKIFV